MKMKSYIIYVKCSPFNLVSPDIKIHNHSPLTVLHTFLTELVRRICLSIKTSHPW